MNFYKMIFLIGSSVFICTTSLHASHTPSSFEIGRDVGSNISNGIRGAEQKRIMRQIIENIQHCETQEDVLVVSGQIFQYLSPEQQPLAMQILQLKIEILKSSENQRSK